MNKELEIKSLIRNGIIEHLVSDNYEDEEFDQEERDKSVAYWTNEVYKLLEAETTSIRQENTVLKAEVERLKGRLGKCENAHDMKDITIKMMSKKQSKSDSVMSDKDLLDQEEYIFQSPQSDNLTYENVVEILNEYKHNLTELEFRECAMEIVELKNKK